MAQAQKKNDNTVLWWIGWIVLTIVTFFISCYFWTGFIAKHVGPIQQAGVSVLWVTAVFGTWMLFLVPLIIVMYNKVDRAYEDTRIERETKELQKSKKGPETRSILVPEADRLLPKNISDLLKKMPRAIRRGHLVTAVLKSGQRVENVFILDKQEILGIYNADKFPFKAEDVAALEPANLDHLPAFETKKWLRLDGAGLPL